MKSVFKNNLIKNYIILLVFTTVLELSFRKISGIPVWDISFLRIFIGLNLCSVLLSFIFSWLNKGFNKLAVILSCAVFTGYSFFQLGFNNFIGVYASVNSSSQLGAVTDYIKDFFASFLNKYYLILIPFAILLLYYAFIDGRLKYRGNKRFVLRCHVDHEPILRTILSLFLIFIFSVCYLKTLTVEFMQNDLQMVSNKDLFAYPSVPSIVVNQFGVLGFGYLDIKSYQKEAPSTDIDYIVDNGSNKPSDREIDDSLWKELIDNESNKTLNKINNTLINSIIPNYNDHTGLFEGKNLVVLMLESVNDIIIDKDLYPNFYKIYSEGISFKNNYSPRNSCATMNNEFSGMTGLYTIQNTCTANQYMNNKYFTSIFNLFNDAGYKTSSMHNYTEQFYYRSTIHKNLGSMAYYGVQKLGIPYFNVYEEWSSDEDFLEAAMNITLSDTSKPFMVWLTTVSGHQPYNVKSVEGNKYLDITEGTGYPMELRRYMSKLKTVDNALGILLKRLEEAGELDNTVIALYGDHYPYGLRKSVIDIALDYDLDDYEIERVPMAIYNSTIKPEVVEKYNSYINFTPTIANLFNLNYDPRYYMGSDIFDEDYLDLVVFADGSWKNSKAYYNASKASIKYYTDEELNGEEIKRINNIIATKMGLSNSIIKNNYFNYLQKELKKLESSKIKTDIGGLNEESSNSGIAS